MLRNLWEIGKGKEDNRRRQRKRERKSRIHFAETGVRREGDKEVFNW